MYNILSFFTLFQVFQYHIHTWHIIEHKTLAHKFHEASYYQGNRPAGIKSKLSTKYMYKLLEKGHTSYWNQVKISWILSLLENKYISLSPSCARILSNPCLARLQSRSGWKLLIKGQRSKKMNRWISFPTDKITYLSNHV